jgi:hypothetical protein
LFCSPRIRAGQGAIGRRKPDITKNGYETQRRRYRQIYRHVALISLEPLQQKREGAAMPQPPDLSDLPDQPRGAMRLAQGLLIVAIMALIMIALVSTN